MAKKGEEWSDEYAQFKDLVVTLDGSNSTTLVEVQHDTNLSVRGGFIWEMHALEYIIEGISLGAVMRTQWALSTQKGKAAIPELGDTGLYARGEYVQIMTTSGAIASIWPQWFVWAPAIPCASPNLSMYAKTSVDAAAVRGTKIRARLHYTTKKTDANVYTELAELWGG